MEIVENRQLRLYFNTKPIVYRLDSPTYCSELILVYKPPLGLGMILLFSQASRSFNHM